MCAKSPQLCPALCDSMDYFQHRGFLGGKLVVKNPPANAGDLKSHPPGSSVHGILQIRILEWVAISFSRGSSQSRDRTHVSYVSCIASRFFFFFFLPQTPPGKAL